MSFFTNTPPPSLLSSPLTCVQANTCVKSCDAWLHCQCAPLGALDEGIASAEFHKSLHKEKGEKRADLAT